jgi:hypothetical protein
MPQEDGWSEMGDWLAEIGGDDHARPPGDGHAGSDDSDNPRPEAPAQADAHPQAHAYPQADAPAEALGEAAVTRPAMTARLETVPDQLAITPDPTPANPPVAAKRNRPRPLEVAQCSLCGIVLPLGLLVPDGGQTCADIHWYCKDATSCTKRWTTAHPPGLAHMPAAADTPTKRKDV